MKDPISTLDAGFESNFREINGRSPTPDEIKRHLSFDRLAKTTDLDPATLLLIVDAQRSVQKKSATQYSPARELLAFVLALLSFAAIVVFVDSSPARTTSIALYCGAVALGVAASGLYVVLTSRR